MSERTRSGSKRGNRFGSPPTLISHTSALQFLSNVDKHRVVHTSRVQTAGSQFGDVPGVLLELREYVEELVGSFEPRLE